MTLSQRIEELFHRAVDLPPGERTAFLAEQCGDNLQLRAGVEELLRHDAAATTDFALRSPLAAQRDQPASLATPTQIGPYRIVSMLGEGGMGSVYEAEQVRPVKRTVALKVIKLGMDTRDVIARFEAERQALAVMDHPSIARVYDAGATENGRPYFVMEFVRGTPITRYCDDNLVSTRQRLELFVKVCDAVQHAHTKGIIHRDLKPGNILVTEVDGVASPRVIDFGIAKATSSPLTERTLHTGVGQMLGTPEYMSPEQARPGDGGDIDTRTDVYSLGAVLYELLSGAQPFDAKSLRSGGYQEIQRIIRDVDPPRPSTRFELAYGSSEIAARRQETLHSLKRLLRRELEWIPLMAMRKERDQRYRSAAELADDLRAYLAGRPLIAAPESSVYRARKFLRRNARVVTAAAAMAALLVAGIVTTSVQAIRANREKARAEQRFDDVRALARGMLFDVQTSVSKLPGSQEATQRIVNLSREYLEKLEAEKTNDVTLITDVVSAYLRLGDIQGRSNVVSSNDARAARASWEKAAVLAERAMTLAPTSSVALNAVAEVEFTFGDAETASGNFDTARRHFDRALQHYTAAAAVATNKVKGQHDVLLTQTRIATNHFARSRIPDAIETQTRAIESARKLVAENPGNNDVKSLLASSLTDLSTMKQRSGDFGGADEALAESLRFYELLHAADPADSRYENSLADAYLSIALSCRMRGESAGEAQNMAKAIEHARRLTVNDTTSPNHQHLLGAVLLNASDSKSIQSDWPGAAECLKEAIAVYNKLLAVNDTDNQARGRLSVAYGAMGNVLEKQGLFDESIAAISKAIDTISVQASADPGNIVMQAGVAYYQLLKGLTQTRAVRLDDAIVTLRSGLATFEKVVTASPDDVLARRNGLITRRALAEALVAASDVADVERSKHDAMRGEARELLIQTRAGYTVLIELPQPIPADVAAAKEVEIQIASLDAPATQPN